MSSILITRPNHDQTTDYLSYWTKPVVDLAKKHLKTFDLAEQRANKKDFESYTKTHSPTFIFLNGHGSESQVTGYNNEVLIDARDKNLKAFSKSLFYIRSCKSGKILGPKLVQKGAHAFIGYEYNFIFLRDIKYTTKPLRDPTAKLFLEPSNLVASTLIKGHTVQEAYERSQKQMRKNLSMILSSGSGVEERNSAAFLWSNITAQVLHGNPNAKI